MARLRKLRKAKKFRYNISRKRSNKKERSTGTIKCPEIKKAWENRKTMTNNLNDIGLARDPNKVIKIPNVREQRLKMVKIVNGFMEEDNANKPAVEIVRPKGFVMQQMEEDANALRESNFRLPKGVIALLSEMLDNYGLDYKAMVRDEKNYDQITWKQYRAKIRRFMSIPQQFDKYLESRGLTRDALDWEECDSDYDI